MAGARRARSKRSVFQYFAIAAFALGLISLAMTLMAGPGYTMGLWDYRTGLGVVLKYGAMLAAVAAGLALLGAVASIIMGKAQGRGTLILTLVLGLGQVGYVLPWYYRVQQVPPIHDVTTDLENPPEFTAIPARDYGAAGLIVPARENVPETADLSPIERWRLYHARAYGEIKALNMAFPPDEALIRARRTVEALGWTIVDFDIGAGWLEAYETSTWFKFRDNVVIRIQPTEAGSKLDLRSVSEVGISDLGENAKRIERFIALFREQNFGAATARGRS